MKKKLFVKKIILFVSIIVCFCFNIQSVKADCVYLFDKPNYKYDEASDKMVLDYVETKKIVISWNGTTSVSGTCEAYNPNVWNSRLDCYLLDKNANSSLFVIENGNLYCPSKIYINDVTGEYISLATDASSLKNITVTHDGVSFKREVKNYSVVTKSAVAGDNYFLYNNDNEGAQKLNSCKKDWNTNVINEYETFVKNYGSDIESGKIEDVKTVNDFLGKLENMEDYCGYFSDSENKEKISNTIVQLKRIAEYNIKNAETDAEKEEWGTVVETVSDYSATLTKDPISNMDIEFDDKVIPCQNLISDDLKMVIQFVLKMIRIAVPILLIVLITVDLAQAVMSNDQDATKKAVSKSIKRACAAIVVFFVPLIVSIMLDWIVLYDNELGIKKENVDCTSIIKEE